MKLCALILFFDLLTHSLRLLSTVLAARGQTFLKLNHDLFERYSHCATPLEVVAAQNAWLKQMEAERNQRIEVLYPPSHSEDEGEGEEADAEELAQSQRRKAQQSDADAQPAASSAAAAAAPDAAAVDDVAAQLADASVATQ